MDELHRYDGSPRWEPAPRPIVREDDGEDVPDDDQDDYAERMDAYYEDVASKRADR